MSVLVDTPIWSLALRRSNTPLSARERLLVMRWQELIREGRAELTGVVRQEVLSGVRGEEGFRVLRKHLTAILDIEVDTADHERAAQFYNVCRSKGIAATHIDMLLCAISMRHAMELFTTDRDFERYARVLGLSLFAPG
jgi:predicted nucleic acid-binding protein